MKELYSHNWAIQCCFFFYFYFFIIKHVYIWSVKRKSLKYYGCLIPVHVTSLVATDAHIHTFHSSDSYNHEIECEASSARADTQLLQSYSTSRSEAKCKALMREHVFGFTREGKWKARTMILPAI